MLWRMQNTVDAYSDRSNRCMCVYVCLFAYVRFPGNCHLNITWMKGWGWSLKHLQETALGRGNNETHWFEGQKKASVAEIQWVLISLSQNLSLNSRITEPTVNWTSPLGCLKAPQPSISKTNLISSPKPVPSHFSKLQFHHSSCSSHKSWSNPWFYPTSKPSTNLIGSTFKIYPESNYFPSPPLLPPWSVLKHLDLSLCARQKHWRFFRTERRSDADLQVCWNQLVSFGECCKTVNIIWLGHHGSIFTTDIGKRYKSGVPSHTHRDLGVQHLPAHDCRYKSALWKDNSDRCHVILYRCVYLWIHENDLRNFLHSIFACLHSAKDH